MIKSFNSFFESHSLPVCPWLHIYSGFFFSPLFLSLQITIQRGNVFKTCCLQSTNRRLAFPPNTHTQTRTLIKPKLTGVIMSFSPAAAATCVWGQCWSVWRLHCLTWNKSCSLWPQEGSICPSFMFLWAWWGKKNIIKTLTATLTTIRLMWLNELQTWFIRGVPRVWSFWWLSG